MDTAFTSPAPWTLRSEGHSLAVDDRNGLAICELYHFDRASDERTANGRLIAQAPALLALAKSFKCSCEERISILKDEWIAAQYGGDGVIQDIDDQIAHWTSLLDRCDTVLDAVKYG